MDCENALARLLSDSDLCRRIGSAGHDWVSHNYTSEAMALKYRQMYDEVLGTPPSATVPAQRWTTGTLMRGARESMEQQRRGNRIAQAVSSYAL